MNAPDALPAARAVPLRDWPDLPHHDPVRAAFRRAVADCPAPTFIWNDVPATIAWRPDNESAPRWRHCLQCRVGEFTIRLACDTLAPLLGELPYDIGDMPPAFRVPLLDDLLAGPRQALELLLDRKIEILALTESYAAQEGDCEIRFTLDIGRPAARLQGVLAGSVAFVAACVTAPLAGAARTEPPAPSAAVPLRCGLLAGRMTLSVEEWRSLRPGDVLLAERAAGSAARPAYRLVVGGVRLALWNAVRSGEQMMVEDHRSAATPPDETPGDDALPDAVTDVGALPVRLEFFAGTATMRLDRLAALRPGHVFEMPDALRDGAVDIRVHGRVVGKGEMVAVGDRLGIRLLEIRVKDDGSAA